MKIRNKKLIVWFSLMAVIGVAGAAWACSAQPRLLVVAPIRGEPAEAVEITSVGTTGSVPMTIRWNTLNGPKLAEFPVPASSGTIKVPNVAPGIYFIVAETSEGVARSAFEVTASASETAGNIQPSSSNQALQSDLWQGFAPGKGAVSEPAQLSDSPANSGGTFGAGAALAGAGLLGLTAFAGVAARRRRLEAIKTK